MKQLLLVLTLSLGAFGCGDGDGDGGGSGDCNLVADTVIDCSMGFLDASTRPALVAGCQEEPGRASTCASCLRAESDRCASLAEGGTCESACN
ncbi:MAG: hypothetical protein AAF411_17000 [Myxococcota bacterium]